LAQLVEQNCGKFIANKFVEMNSSSSRQTTLNENAPPIPLTGSGAGFVAADWKSIFEKAGLRTLEDFFPISGKALSKPGLGKRYRAQLELKNGTETVSVFYKRYDGESWRNFLQRWFEDGANNAIACREVRVADTLEKIGVATFKPLAWGWSEDSGVAQKSFIVMSQVQGESLERWVANANLQWPEKLRLVEQLAGLAKKLHQSGWFHRDFYLCHIFIRETDGAYQLALVDLARMFRPRWRANRWQTKDLAQLNFSTPLKYFSRTLRLRFAKFYLGVERLSPAHKSLLLKIARRSESIARRESRK
jgi:serine/threonine protein kinase